MRCSFFQFNEAISLATYLSPMQVMRISIELSRELERSRDYMSVIEVLKEALDGASISVKGTREENNTRIASIARKASQGSDDYGKVERYRCLL
jgi:hypothetical protein